MVCWSFSLGRRLSSELAWAKIGENLNDGDSSWCSSAALSSEGFAEPLSCDAD